ncbi:hypothetical protein B0A49_00089 [Cryomyces minteri]|uniref:Rho-GAP domain-containing protein n=1 Tax=Cryomyces minteri TaxID=331657 RepID=A0A4U0Y1X1_9PEZI|nr:hypothetical protein B0A49_00089 [Cryomyces minteri]
MATTILLRPFPGVQAFVAALCSKQVWILAPSVLAMETIKDHAYEATSSARIHRNVSGTSFVPSNLDAVRYIGRYNISAQQFGLSKLPTHDSVNEPASTEVGPRSSVDGAHHIVSYTRAFINKTFGHKSELSHTRNPSNERQLSRKNSSSHLGSRKPRGTMPQMTLQGILHLGGVGMVYLPQHVSPGPLVLPASFAAMVSHLVEHGHKTGGIFRIPGNLAKVNGLVDYYASQLQTAEKSKGYIETTVYGPALPWHLTYSTQDVAHALKRLLGSIVGGMLGSPLIHKALSEITQSPLRNLHLEAQKDEKCRLIALCILSSKSDRRPAFTMAMFGLLALLKAEAPYTEDSMSAEALAVCFAPLLIGDLDGSTISKSAIKYNSLYDLPCTAIVSHGNKGSKAPITSERAQELARKALSENQLNVDIIARMLDNWTDIVRHIRILTTPSEVTEERAWDIPHGGHHLERRDSAYQQIQLSRDEFLNSQRNGTMIRSSSTSHLQAKNQLTDITNLPRSTSVHFALPTTKFSGAANRGKVSRMEDDYCQTNIRLDDSKEHHNRVPTNETRDISASAASTKSDDEGIGPAPKRISPVPVGEPIIHKRGSKEKMNATRAYPQTVESSWASTTCSSVSSEFQDISSFTCSRHTSLAFDLHENAAPSCRDAPAPFQIAAPISRGPSAPLHSTPATLSLSEYKLSGLRGVSSPVPSTKPTPSKNLSTIYAENRRLQLERDMIIDENAHLLAELKMLRQFQRDNRDLAEKLRQMSEERDAWKGKAAWVESRLQASVSDMIGAFPVPPSPRTMRHIIGSDMQVRPQLASNTSPSKKSSPLVSRLPAPAKATASTPQRPSAAGLIQDRAG